VPVEHGAQFYTLQLACVGSSREDPADDTAGLTEDERR